MPAIALILAAGMGTRMRSRLAKVLHPVLGWPMVQHAAHACQQAGLAVRVVVNHQEEAVRAALGPLGVEFSRQSSPLGTGHAVACALPDLPAEGTLLVLPGDAPLLRSETLAALLAAHDQALCTCLSMELPDPAEYGRIVREGQAVRIVEAVHLDPTERAALREVNSGIYAFDLAFLHEVLPGLRPHPPKGELYLTDVLELASERGGARVILHRGPPEELLGVNDRWALSQAEGLLGERLKRQHALAGVSFQDPASTRVEVEVQLGEDVVIGPGCVLRRGTRIQSGVEVGPHCVLADCEVASGARIEAHSVVQGAKIASGAVVGPFARLRPGAELRAGARVGNFVEVKNAVLEEGAKANHLAYIGDARIGARANIGAGTITCNYDGYRKHRTEIGEDAFIGSNSALVAPVKIGARTIVAAGSVLTREVPDDALALGRAPQVNKEGMARDLRARSAELARRAAELARGEKEGRNG